MSLFFIFFGAFVVALSGALMPGPLLTITIAYSIERGFLSGPLLVVGHMLLELFLIIGFLFGLKRFFVVPLVVISVFIIGGVLLLFMGINLILKSFKLKINPLNRSKKNLKRYTPVIDGILISLSNPYWLIWWLTIGLGYLIQAFKFKLLGIVSFFIGHISADFLWYSFISFSFSKGRKFISNKIYHIIIFICGLFLIAFGIWFLYNGSTGNIPEL